MELTEREIHKRIMSHWNHNGNLDDAVLRVTMHEKDQYSIIEELIASLNGLFMR